MPIERSLYIFSRKDGAVKIGISRVPHYRRMNLQRQIKEKLKVVRIFAPSSVAIHVERSVHLALFAYHIGGEWFNASPELAITTVKAVLKESKKAIAAGESFSAPIPLFSQPNRKRKVQTTERNSMKIYHISIRTFRRIAWDIWVEARSYSGNCPADAYQQTIEHCEKRLLTFKDKP
jgi:hypothetical protein